MSASGGSGTACPDGIGPQGGPMGQRPWMARIGVQFLPFRDMISDEFSLARLLRLSLFQVSVGMSVALVVGTLNRVMIVELGVPARLVSIVVAVPLVLAPLRALVGFRSDTHRSALGWRRVPYLWIGTMLQFGGLAIMPFALLFLSGYRTGHAPPFAGPFAAGFAFLLMGAGLHTVQTVGLALATDLAPARLRPRVVAVLCLMLLVGVLASALVFGALLSDFSEWRLIQVVQGAAVVTVVLNGIALWKQEGRGSMARERPRFEAAWREVAAETQSRRRLAAVAIGTVAFSLQDVLLEPYGGQVLRLPVGETTSLTALLAAGGIGGFALAGWALARRTDRYRVAAYGALAGAVAFVLVMLAAPMRSSGLFIAGTGMIGFGAALFLAGTLSSAMERTASVGLALGRWGAVQAFSAGSAIAMGGVLRDVVGQAAMHGRLGSAMVDPATGFEAVYALEVVLLFATLVVLGKLVSFSSPLPSTAPSTAAAQGTMSTEGGR